MALKQSEADHIQRLNFLHSAAHAAFKLCPQLASFYGNEFLTALGEQRTSNTIMRQLCVHCGSPFVDGRSVTRVSVVSNVPSRSTKKAKHNKRKNAKGKIRLVRLRPNEAQAGHADRAETAREERTKQLRDLKNTVQYTCGMCLTRTVMPGSTRSALQEAGLATKTSCADSLRHSEAPMQVDAQHVEASNVAQAVQPNHEPKRAHGYNLSTQLSGGTTKTTETIQSDTTTKKRKRHKSNLLATVAANKKKSEEKKNADNSAFSLNDFLSSL